MKPARHDSWKRPAALVGAAFAACTVFALLLMTQLFGELGSKAVDDFGQTAGDLLAAGACLLTARRAAARLGRGWTLLAAAATSLAIGQLASAVYDQRWYQGGTLVLVAYFFFIAAIAVGFLGVGFILFPFQRPATLIRFVLDSLLITASLLYVSVVLVLDRLIGTGGLTGLQFAVYVVYSAGDVAICSIALLGLSRAPKALRPTALALLAGFLSIAAGDGIQASGNLYSTGSPIDALYLAGVLLVTVAARLNPPRPATAPEGDQEGGWQMAVPYVPAMLAVVVAAISDTTGSPIPPLQRITGIVVVLIALAALVMHRIDLVGMLKRSRTAEAALSNNQQLLDRLLDTAPAGLVSFDAGGRVQLVRGHPLEFMSPGSDLEQRRMRDLTIQSPAALASVERALHGETSQAGIKFDSREMEIICAPVFGPHGAVQSVTGVVLDVTAQRRLQREIAENEAKSQLLATVSHELRTPLNSILGFAYLIETEKAGPLNDKQRRYIGHVQTSGRHLLRLINSILDFSKLAAGGELDVEVSSVDPNEAIAAALEEIRPLVGDRCVETSGAPATCPVKADPVRLEQILLNLLANAVQSTDTKGHILVSCRPVAGALEIAVTDDGVGIPASEQEPIFSRYRQSSGNGRRRSGTGLGLPVSRHLAEQMNGALTVESAAGAGSTFRLRLPAA